MPDEKNEKNMKEWGPSDPALHLPSPVPGMARAAPTSSTTRLEKSSDSVSCDILSPNTNSIAYIA